MPSSIAQLFSLPEKSSLKRKTSPSLVSDAMVGVEIEVEGLPKDRRHYTKLKRINSHWKVETDGSLRTWSRDSNAMEFIFKEPMFGVDVVDALTNLQRQIKQNAIFSKRTSVHVHLDVRDLSLSQLLRLLCVYTMVEPIMFSLVADHRKVNPYCIPLRECLPWLDRLGRALGGGGPTRIIHLNDYRGGKYTSLNLLPVSNLGSVEFRHKEGSCDKDELLSWINVILSLKSFATSIDTPVSVEEFESYADNYTDFVIQVFGRELIPNIEELANRNQEGAALLAKRVTQAYDSFEFPSITCNPRSYFWKNASDAVIQYGPVSIEARHYEGEELLPNLTDFLTTRRP